MNMPVRNVLRTKSVIPVRARIQLPANCIKLVADASAAAANRRRTPMISESQLSRIQTSPLATQNSCKRYLMYSSFFSESEPSPPLLRWLIRSRPWKDCGDGVKPSLDVLV
jgi:hypothetical protein